MSATAGPGGVSPLTSTNGSVALTDGEAQAGWADTALSAFQRLGPVRRVPVPTGGDHVAVRWYLRYGLSYRDVEELLAERGITVDHVTVYRWHSGSPRS